MKEMKTVKIKIWGIVQGVGFRPFVAKLADRFGMKGEVLNIGGLVDIVLSDTPDRIEAFLEALKKEKPVPAEIVHINILELPYRDFESFVILDSDEGDDEAAMIPADLSICPDCLAELQEERNPRFQHPFISCMVCGPRYTIIDKIPYDRENTSMMDFPMCEFCHGEYTNRHDRRYHAQTISCHECGPMLEYRLSGDYPTESSSLKVSRQEAAAIGLIGWKGSGTDAQKNAEPLAWAMNLILNGSIIALKGVGGYYFVCSPFREDAVKMLRNLKIREEKPFAVMFQNIEEIKNHCLMSEEEERLLLSSAKPIVLLERKQERKENGKAPGSGTAAQWADTDKSICEEVYRSSRFIGAFLPSMGLQHMLLEFCGPLIMTSANLSDMPIIKDEEEMFALMASNPNLAGVFYNERKIRIRLDDSVARIIDGQPQMIRRSKGYAPVPLYIANKLSKHKMIFAAGGQLKSSFALSKGPFSYVSQYFGDLDSKEACDLYQENLDRMKELFRIRPNLAVCDLHPLYFTTKFTEEYASRHNIPILKVQHHHAHVASVMAEHHLKGTVIGISFDGTGYGTDGNVWGGEFLLCKGAGFDRLGHLDYVRMVGGDTSMKEGWKSSMCYLYHHIQRGELQWEDLPQVWKEDPRWPMVKGALEHGINTIESSSMGRLFDAVAALSGIQQVNRYEGECAIMLENEAASALQRGLEPVPMSFAIGESGPGGIDSAPIFRSIVKALREGIDKGRIALGFHDAVAEMIRMKCIGIRKEKGTNEAALTGGVFQNKILMEKTLHLLRKEGFQVYYNISVGPNDGGICVGQNYIGMHYMENKA